MKVYGASLLKGLMYTLKTFVGTYMEDIKGTKNDTKLAQGSRT